MRDITIEWAQKHIKLIDLIIDNQSRLDAKFAFIRKEVAHRRSVPSAFIASEWEERRELHKRFMVALEELQ